MSKLFTVSRPTSFRQYIGRVAKFYAFVIVGWFIGNAFGNWLFNRQLAKAAAKAAHPSSVAKDPWGSAPLAQHCCSCSPCSGLSCSTPSRCYNCF